jgi:hypothetical protein
VPPGGRRFRSTPRHGCFPSPNQHQRFRSCSRHEVLVSFCSQPPFARLRAGLTFAGPFLPFSRCEGTGHFARDCPTPFNAAPSNARPKACYRCQSLSHIARDCPTNEIVDLGAQQASAVATDATVLVPAAVENHA